MKVELNDLAAFFVSATWRVYYRTACCFFLILGAQFSQEVFAGNMPVREVVGDFVVRESNRVELEYFGLHIFYPHIDTKWPKIGFGSLRIWDVPGTTWAEIQPAPDRWEFSALDKVVELAEKNGKKVLYTLGQTPQWASKRPFENASKGLGFAAEPADVENWTRYIKTIARRYKGRIHAYEIGNEPRFSDLFQWRGSGFYSGSAKKMVELSRLAYVAIKNIDPSAVIVSPGMDGDQHGVAKFRLFLQEGGIGTFDVVGWHFYSLQGTEPEILQDQLERLKRCLGEFGLDQVPIWNTETGVRVDLGRPVRPGDTQGVLSRVFSIEQAANYLSRSMLILGGGGVKRNFWFAWDSGSMGMISALPPRGPTEIAEVYDGLVKSVAGFVISPCSRVDDGVFACRLRNEIHEKIAIWSVEGNRKFIIPSSWRVKKIASLSGELGVIDGGYITLKERPVFLIVDRLISR